MVSNQDNDFMNSLEANLQNSDSYMKEMMRFFDDGYDARGVDDKIKFENRLKANIFTTLTYLSEIFNELAKVEFKVKSAYFKLTTANSLEVLIALGLDEYLDQRLLSIYNFTNEIEKKSKSDVYRVTFSFTYDEGNLDEDCLQSDGYISALRKEKV